MFSVDFVIVTRRRNSSCKTRATKSASPVGDFAIILLQRLWDTYCRLSIYISSALHTFTNEKCVFGHIVLIPFGIDQSLKQTVTGCPLVQVLLVNVGRDLNLPGIPLRFAHAPKLTPEVLILLVRELVLPDSLQATISLRRQSSIGIF